MISKFLKALIILSRLKFFKIFINLIENVACKFILLNKKKLYSNFLSILQLFSSIVISFALFLSLIYFDWKTSIIAITLFFLVYSLLAKFIRSTLVKNSVLVAKSSSNQVQSLQEGLGFVRDMILDNSYDIHIKRYNKK